MSYHKIEQVSYPQTESPHWEIVNIEDDNDVVNQTAIDGYTGVPVYDSNGEIVSLTQLHVTPITLNGIDKNFIQLNKDYSQYTPIQLYAPTSVGNNGQILQSLGSGAPSWVDNPTGGAKFWKGSETQYNDIAIKDNNTLYIVTDDIGDGSWSLIMSGHSISTPITNLITNTNSLNLLNDESATIIIKSPESWTLTSTSGRLTFSSQSGNAGKSTITVTADNGSTSFNDVITIATANDSKTISVTYNHVTLVDYIHNSTMANSSTAKIDTPIYIDEIAYTRIKGMFKGYYTSYSCLAGATNDFLDALGMNLPRISSVIRPSVSNGSTRQCYIENVAATDNTPFDISFTRQSITNNLTGERFGTGDTKFTSHLLFGIGVGLAWFKSVTLYDDNGTPLFNALAALDENNAACFYDTVSGQYYTNPNLTLVAEN